MGVPIYGYRFIQTHGLIPHEDYFRVAGADGPESERSLTSNVKCMVIVLNRGGPMKDPQIL